MSKSFFRCLIAVCVWFMCAISPCSAQKFSIATNLLDYANLGTLNLDFSYALSQHWSVVASAKYNPFIFKNGLMQNRQRCFAVGGRWWSWHTFSGFWLSSKMQYQEFNVGGIRSPQTREGDSYGVSLSGGYSYMIGRHFNIEAGLGLWGGWQKYVVYDCPRCGATREKGDKFFVLPNDIIISIAYVF